MNQHNHEEYAEQWTGANLTHRDLLEFRASYFFFTLQNPRNVYGTSLFSLEAENNYWFWKATSVFANFNFTWDAGKTVALNTPSQMYIPTLSAGVKEFFPITEKDLFVYLGIGLSVAIPYTVDSSNHLDTYTTRFSPGLVGKSGFLWMVKPRIAFDFFFDYYLQPTTKKMNSSFGGSLTDIGGFRTGGGVGYLF